MKAQLKPNIEQDTSSKLDQIIFFLTLNFFKENPDSFLSDGAYIEKGIIYNSSFSELIYDIGEKELYIRLCSTICDETSIFKVCQGCSYYYHGKLVYSSGHYTDDSFPDRVDVYIPGGWEEAILREFEKRKK